MFSWTFWGLIIFFNVDSLTVKAQPRAEWDNYCFAQGLQKGGVPQGVLPG